MGLSAVKKRAVKERAVTGMGFRAPTIAVRRQYCARRSGASTRMKGNRMAARTKTTTDTTAETPEVAAPKKAAAKKPAAKAPKKNIVETAVAAGNFTTPGNPWDVSGAKPAWYFALDAVSETEPYVRPWNAPPKARTGTLIVALLPFTIIPPLDRMRLGFFETNINGREVIAHLGDTGAFHSSLHLFLNENTGLYLSLNSGGENGASNGVRVGLFARFADRYFPAPPRHHRFPPECACRPQADDLRR